MHLLLRLLLKIYLATAGGFVNTEMMMIMSNEHQHTLREAVRDCTMRVMPPARGECHISRVPTSYVKMTRPSIPGSLPPPAIRHVAPQHSRALHAFSVEMLPLFSVDATPPPTPGGRGAMATQVGTMAWS